MGKHYFHHRFVFLDSAPLIYFIEKHPQYYPTVASIFQQNEQGGFKFVTSSITLLEVMTIPLRRQLVQLEKKYNLLFEETLSDGLYDIERDIILTAMNLRAKYNLKTPDSLQIATALMRGADVFLTNDIRLKTVECEGLEIVLLDEL